MSNFNRWITRKALMRNRSICICGKKMRLKKFAGKKRKWFCPYCEKDKFRLIRALMERQEQMKNQEINNDV